MTMLSAMRQKTHILFSTRWVAPPSASGGEADDEVAPPSASGGEADDEDARSLARGGAKADDEDALKI